MGKKLAASEILIVPGVYDALTARLVELAGFEAAYLSGAGVSYSSLARPDLGLVTQTEMVERLSRITHAVSLSIIADGDDGHGNALNLMRTVRMFERAGAQAIQIEDQKSPKRCGHLAGKRLISVAEMVGKIRAARRARSSSEFIIIARTDARGVVGLDAAIARARAYAEAGADALFVEAPRSRDELAAIAEALPTVPLVANMVEGGVTPPVSAAELQAMGYAMVLYPNTLTRRFVTAAREVLDDLRTRGTTADARYPLASFTELGDLLGRARLAELEDEFVPAATSPGDSDDR